MNLYQIRVDIYEAATGGAYPIVTHFFTGKTPEEATSYHEAHRQADAFLRGCEDKGLFLIPNRDSQSRIPFRDESVSCRAVQTEGWIQMSSRPITGHLRNLRRRKRTR